MEDKRARPLAYLLHPAPDQMRSELVGNTLGETHPAMRWSRRAYNESIALPLMMPRDPAVGVAWNAPGGGAPPNRNHVCASPPPGPEGPAIDTYHGVASSSNCLSGLVCCSAGEKRAMVVTKSCSCKGGKLWSLTHVAHVPLREHSPACQVCHPSFPQLLQSSNGRGVFRSATNTLSWSLTLEIEERSSPDSHTRHRNKTTDNPSSELRLHAMV